MTFAEAQRFYKTSRVIAGVLRLTDSRISQFKSQGGIPYPEQCVLEKDSAGKLVARRKDDPSSSQEST